MQLIALNDMTKDNCLGSFYFGLIQGIAITILVLSITPSNPVRINKLIEACQEDIPHHQKCVIAAIPEDSDAHGH